MVYGVELVLLGTVLQMQLKIVTSGLACIGCDKWDSEYVPVFNS